VVIPFYRPEIATLEMKFISGAANAISQSEYSLILIDYTERQPDKIERFVNSRLVDGFILLEVHLHDRRVNILKRANVPFVMVGRCADNSGLYLIDQDVHDSMEQIIRHFYLAGHRSVAYLYKYDPQFSFIVNSLEGYHQACIHYGITPITRPCELTPEDGRRVMEALLTDHPEVSAVFVWSDIPTLGVIEAVQARGLNTPHEFGVICQEHTILSSLPTFAASILNIRAEELTANAARMLIDLIEDRPIAEPHLLLKPMLMIKGETPSHKTSGFNSNLKVAMNR
jgi:DNA-binding LacI/PurR family transcriptional regulator